MAKTKKPTLEAPVPRPESALPPAASIPHPRLHKLRVCNFRCIGPTPVEIELDDIVVLVGPNNAGKSSLLRAYEIVMLHGSDEGKLTIDDFPNGRINSAAPPTIELETVVFDKTAPGERWIRVDTATNEMHVREKWTWAEPGAPKKVGWEVSTGNWHATEGPWGAANIAQAYRPKPHHVTAFADPLVQAAQVADILKEELSKRVKEAKKKRAGSSGDGELSDYERLLDNIRGLQRAIATDATTAIDKLRTDLTKMVGDVFPGYSVTLDARPEDDLEKTVSLFKAAPLLRMGPLGGHQATVDRQGSGACRTLLWAALRILAEQPEQKAPTATDRPHLLLMDEPELCLHPDAIRDACKVLYDLPNSKNWQVMITTHSPVFIDLSRDNTSIVRVERTPQGDVHGTTIFRPNRAKLDSDDRVELKLLNLCDPHVAEFFFGGHTIVVEGDTEYTAFRYLASLDPAKYKGIQIVRARGKACIKSLCKILNQFEKDYAVLHDSDRPSVKPKKGGAARANPMWTENSTILDATRTGREAGSIRLVASVPNFEEAFFVEAADGEKPFGALVRLRTDSSARAAVSELLDSLIDSSKAVPGGAKEWSDVNELLAAVQAFDGTTPAAPTASKAS